MKKSLMSFIAILFYSITVHAQLPYIFSVSSQTYTPLSTSSTANAGAVWDGSSFYNFVAATGFTYLMDTCTNNYFCLGDVTNLEGDSVYNTSKTYRSFFMLLDADLVDRGFISGTSVSPLKYEIDGSAGHRIFKAEVANAGFYGESVISGTLNDYVNFQVWIYEDSGTVEFRYGPSSVTKPADYFYHGSGPEFAFFKDMDRTDNAVAYYLEGNPSSPTLKRVPISMGVGTISYNTLNSWPANGTVYRFGPGSTPDSASNVDNIENAGIKVYPTICKDKITIENKTPKNTIYTVTSATGNSTSISGEIRNNIENIDLGRLAAGTYVLQLKINGKAYTKKFVKL